VAGASVTSDPDIAVVGAGVMGLATAWALAPTGLSVTVFEQFAVGHLRGSSHGTARIFKVAYPDADSVRMVMRAQRLWRDLEGESGDEILSLTGTLDVGDLDRRQRALGQCGVAFELLDAPTVKRRHGLSIDAHATALWQPDGGVLQADRAQRALLTSARSHGVEVVEQTVVKRLARVGNRLRVETSEGDVRARAVVVTAGAWVEPLVEPLGVALSAVPTRETVSYFMPRDPAPTPPLSQWGSLLLGQVAYGLLTRAGEIKVGLHRAGPVTDPDETDHVDDATVEYAAQWASQHFDLDPIPIRAETCLYTNLPGERFALERNGRLVVGSACSGHGFKFAPVVGQRLAALALEAAGR
jgi:sarcosine oxidase